MRAAYCVLHELGWAHSIEAWRDSELVGGLYGVAIGRVFFGESMFSRISDASKIALVEAVEFLVARGFALIDCQVWSSHSREPGRDDDTSRQNSLPCSRTLQAARGARPVDRRFRRVPRKPLISTSFRPGS